MKKINLTFCRLLIAQDLWQVHYQILSVIFLKELSELNVRHDDKKCEICRIEYKHWYCFLENFKDDLIEYKYLCCNKIYWKNV